VQIVLLVSIVIMLAVLTSVVARSWRSYREREAYKKWRSTYAPMLK
jgi:Tfp pilus assembly protein PilE